MAGRQEGIQIVGPHVDLDYMPFSWQHLEACEECRRCADEIRSTVRVIRENAYDPVTEEERQRLRARLWASLE